MIDETGIETGIENLTNAIVLQAVKDYHRAQPENMPLTLDELRQMDGEPVCVMPQDGSGARWGIVKDTEHGLCAVVDDDTAYWFTDVCGTIAYRTKPKEVEHEALEMV